MDQALALIKPAYDVFIFIFNCYFTVDCWKTSDRLFTMGRHKMAWFGVALSAVNGVCAVDFIF